MPTAHRQIADAARVAWDRATALLLAARVEGRSRADCDALADYADAARDRWRRADYRARREEEYRPDPLTILAALDCDPRDTFAEPEGSR